jgi:hypothetical protein
MRKRTKIAASLFVLFVLFWAAAAPTQAKPSEYDQIVDHLKTKYRAKKVKIPFMWLARFAVGIVRPAGVKSFSVTLFEDLKFSRESLDAEMQQALSRTFTEEWQSVFRVRSREGQQAYMYMREAGSNIRLTLVTIDQNKAAIIRATFSPEKLVEFTNDPKIFGISIGDKKDEPAQLQKTDTPPTDNTESK